MRVTESESLCHFKRYIRVWVSRVNEMTKGTAMPWNGQTEVLDSSGNEKQTHHFQARNINLRDHFKNKWWTFVSFSTWTGQNFEKFSETKMNSIFSHRHQTSFFVERATEIQSSWSWRWDSAFHSIREGHEISPNEWFFQLVSTLKTGSMVA